MMGTKSSPRPKQQSESRIISIPEHLRMVAEERRLRVAIAAAQQKARLKQKLESSSEYQKRRMMSKDEKGALAIETVSKKYKEYLEVLTGQEQSIEACRRKVIAMQMKFETDRK